MTRRPQASRWPSRLVARSGQRRPPGCSAARNGLNRCARRKVLSTRRRASPTTRRGQLPPTPRPALRQVCTRQELNERCGPGASSLPSAALPAHMACGPALVALARPAACVRHAQTGTVEGMAAGLVTLFLCGDVMLGRGVDQVLPHPGDPQLRETYARDAAPMSAWPSAPTAASRCRPASAGPGVTPWPYLTRWRPTRG